MNGRWYRNTVGKKMVMALSGVLLVLFLVAHVLGNLTIYFSWLNAYAHHLRALPPLLWAFRTGLFAVFTVHVFFGIWLYRENTTAKPASYAVKKSRTSTFAGRNMIWTGALIAVFLIYHLLHFTFQVTNPGISSHFNLDPLGRPDVRKMVVLSFRKFSIAAIYVIAMAALALHLSHGLQSFVQTLGWNNDRTLPKVIRAGIFAAFVSFLVYIAIPVSIVTGLLGWESP